eukprot:GHVS01024519.1.p1 GENE.GHVS01024519.1~~GHVS01024519.1.p1  ORF type:complete len:823 (+),score=199.35 GHVS01024519.1:296-2764(+)
MQLPRVPPSPISSSLTQTGHTNLPPPLSSPPASPMFPSSSPPSFNHAPSTPQQRTLPSSHVRFSPPPAALSELPPPTNSFLPSQSPRSSPHLLPSSPPVDTPVTTMAAGLQSPLQPHFGLFSSLNSSTEGGGRAALPPFQSTGDDLRERNSEVPPELLEALLAADNNVGGGTRAGLFKTALADGVEEEEGAYLLSQIFRESDDKFLVIVRSALMTLLTERDEERELRQAAEDRSATATEENERLRENINGLSDETEALRDLCDSQKHELHARTLESQDVQERLEEEMGRFRLYRLETKEWEQKYRDIELNQQQSSERCSLVKSQLAQAEAENAQYARQVTLLKQQLLAKEDADVELRNDVLTQRRQLERDKQRAEEQWGDVQRRLSRQVEEGREEVGKYQQMLQTRLEQDQAREEQVSALREEIDQMREVNNKQSEDLRVMGDVEDKCQKSVSEVAALREQAAELSRMRTLWEESERTVEEWRRTNAQLTNGNAALMAEVESHKQKNVESFKQKNADLAAACDKNHAVEQERESLIVRLTAACDNTHAAEQERESLIVRLEAACENTNAAEKEKETLIVRLATAEKRSREMEGEMRQFQRLATEQRTTLSKCSQLDNVNKKLETDLESKGKQLTEVMGQCKGLQKMVKHRDQHLLQLKEEVTAKSREDASRLNAQLEAISQEKIEYGNKIQELIEVKSKEKFDKWKQKYDQKINKLQAQLSDKDSYEQRMRELMETELLSLQRWNNEMGLWDEAGKRARKAEETGAWKRMMADQLKQLSGRFERRLVRILECRQSPVVPPLSPGDPFSCYGHRGSGTAAAVL